MILAPSARWGGPARRPRPTAASSARRAAPEGSARGGDQQPGHRESRPSGRRPSRWRVARSDGLQALVDGAVLGVHRDDLGARGPAGPLHHRGAGDQRLLVGQGQPAPGFQRGQGHRQTGETDHPVDHHVGRRAGRRQALGPGHDLGPGRHPGGQLGGQGGVADGHQLGPEALGPGRPGGRPSAGRPGPPPGTGRARRPPPRPPGCRSSPWTRPGSPSSRPSIRPSLAADARFQHAIPDGSAPGRAPIGPGRHPRWKALTR